MRLDSGQAGEDHSSPGRQDESAPREGQWDEEKSQSEKHVGDRLTKPRVTCVMEKESQFRPDHESGEDESRA